MNIPTERSVTSLRQAGALPTPDSHAGRRDEVQNLEIPEQRNVGMRAIIEGLKNSIRQSFQNVSQGNNSENIENSIKIISSTSLIL
jgi:hypothetical protein